MVTTFPPARASGLADTRFRPGLGATLLLRVLLLLLSTAMGACHQPTPTPPAARPASAAVVSENARAAPEAREPVRDLSVDESMGGHTLARHVSKSDQELLRRLQREPQISSASTYTDRPTAERVVGTALAAGGNRLAAWLRRSGRRPNLVLEYTEASERPIGRSMSRGQPRSTLCSRALIVLRWDERNDRFYVLTSYPEVDR